MTSRRTERDTWTAEKIRALGVRTDLVTAYAIVTGGGKNRAWKAFHDGELPFPAVRVGRRVVVPVAPILALLGIDTAEPAGRSDPKVGAA